MPDLERPYLVTQTETFRVYAQSEEEACEKLAGMDSREQGECYEGTEERSAVAIDGEAV